MKFATLLLMSSVINIAGCATFDAVNTATENNTARFKQTASQVQELRSAPTNQGTQTVKYIDDQWVSLKPTTVRVRENHSDLRCRLRMATSEPVTLLEVSQIITRECGITIRITPDALTARNADPAAGAGPAPLMNAPGIPLPSPPIAVGGPQAGIDGARNTQTTLGQEKIDINFNGELEGFLNMITARLGLEFKREGNKKYVIYYLDTETFNLHAIASSTDMTSNLEAGTSMVNGVSGASGDAGGAGGAAAAGGVTGKSGSSQKTSVTMKTDIWGDIHTTLESMKTPSKGKVAISPATGMVVVTDTREVLNRMRTYLKKVNDNLTKQITFNVRLVSVTTNTNNQFGISWDAVYRSVSGKYGFNLVSGNGPVSGGNIGAFAILANSKWAGTEAILSALAEQGSVSIIRSPSANTLNLRPVSIQIAKQEGFLAGSSTTSTAQVGSQTAIQTGQITYGFNMSFYPYVMEDDRMLLQFSVNLSNVDGRRTVTSGGASAEVFDISMPINSVQQVKLKAGETLVLAGFDQEDEIASRRGTDSPSNMLFGGSVRAATTKTTLVMLITPTITE